MSNVNGLTRLALCAALAGLAATPALAQTKSQPQSSFWTYVNHQAQKLATPVKVNTPAAVTSVRG